jgi:hypothetical protein
VFDYWTLRWSVNPTDNSVCALFCAGSFNSVRQTSTFCKAYHNAITMTNCNISILKHETTVRTIHDHAIAMSMFFLIYLFLTTYKHSHQPNHEVRLDWEVLDSRGSYQCRKSDNWIVHSEFYFHLILTDYIYNQLIDAWVPSHSSQELKTHTTTPTSGLNACQ